MYPPRADGILAIPTGVVERIAARCHHFRGHETVPACLGSRSFICASEADALSIEDVCRGFLIVFSSEQYLDQMMDMHAPRGAIPPE